MDIELDLNSTEKENFKNLNNRMDIEEVHEINDKSEQQDQNLLYTLSGVLVHSGTAECGHYYSYIRVKKDGKRKWFEFNDTRVTPFEITDENIKNEWFGGKTEAKTSDFIIDWQMDISRSAYMLFYERVEEFSSPETFAKTVPAFFEQKITQENVAFRQLKLYTDPLYLSSLDDFLKYFDSENTIRHLDNFIKEYLVWDEKGQIHDNKYINLIKHRSMKLLRRLSETNETYSTFLNTGVNGFYKSCDNINETAKVPNLRLDAKENIDEVFSLGDGDVFYYGEPGFDND